MQSPLLRATVVAAALICLPALSEDGPDSSSDDGPGAEDGTEAEGDSPAPGSATEQPPPAERGTPANQGGLAAVGSPSLADEAPSEADGQNRGSGGAQPREEPGPLAAPAGLGPDARPEDDGSVDGDKDAVRPPRSKGGPPGWPSLGYRDVEGNLANTGGARSRHSDFIRSLLTFYLGDDNLLAGNVDRSPAFGPNEYPELFFEGLNDEKVANVTETHMVVSGRMPGFLPFVDTEGAFVAEFELSRDPDDARLIGRFRDDGSWLAVTFWFNKAKTGKNLRLTAWPYNADRFRLGYLFDLTWGGNLIYARNRGPVPGFKLNLDLERFYVYVGAKALPRLRADNNEVENYWGVLAGLGPNVWFGPQNRMNLRYDASGGFFARGTFQQDPFRSTPLVAFGVSQRVMLGMNNPRLGYTADLTLFRNDPYWRRRVTSQIPLRYFGKFGFGLSAEFTTLWQSLIDADSPGQRKLSNAITGALMGQVRFARNVRVGIDAIYRDAGFLTFNVPSLVPYVSFAEETNRTPQVYGALWADVFIEKPKLTPGITVGLMQPASFLAGEDDAGNRQLQVIRDANDYEIMPLCDDEAGVCGADANFLTSPYTILSTKASLRWNLSHMMLATIQVAYTQDFNVSRVVADPVSGNAVRVLDRKRGQQLGLNLFLQAAF